MRVYSKPCPGCKERWIYLRLTKVEAEGVLTDGLSPEMRERFRTELAHMIVGSVPLSPPDNPVVDKTR